MKQSRWNWRADFKLYFKGVEQKYIIKCLGITTIFIRSLPIVRGSNVIGQINIIIIKCSFLIFCWESFEVWTHGHQQRLGFFFVMLCRSLLQLTSVNVCLWLFLSLVLSSASEMQLNQVEIRRLTRPLQNITLFYLQKLLYQTVDLSAPNVPAMSLWWICFVFEA